MRTIDQPVIKRRGRAQEFDPKLLANLKKMKPGQWAVFDEFGTVETQKEQSKIGAQVRSHFREVYGENSDLRVSIRWSPENEIQVGLLPAT